MAYVPGFENDIFISYALIDDTAPGNEPGWVTRFHHYLKVTLSQRLGSREALSIWRDPHTFRVSTLLDEEVRQAIENSAVFIALTSRGYLAKESHGLKELATFYRKAESGPYGLRVGSKSRIFKVLLHDIPVQELPSELTGTAGFPFYDDLIHDFSFPLRPNHEQFGRQVYSLANELAQTLYDFKTLVEAHPLPATTTPRDEAPEAVAANVTPERPSEADAPPETADAPTRIFICYRRGHGVGHAAGRLCDRLASHFGHERVFMDISEIDVGDDFVEVITRELSSCNLMLVFIHVGWADAHEVDGRRLHEEGDFVRMEVSEALKRKIRVIPVLLDGAPMPHAEELPEDLRALAHRNAFKISSESWTRDVGELLARLKRHMKV